MKQTIEGNNVYKLSANFRLNNTQRLNNSTNLNKNSVNINSVNRNDNENSKDRSRNDKQIYNKYRGKTRKHMRKGRISVEKAKIRFGNKN